MLYRFGGGNGGANPSASLLVVKGVLYGTTEYGGGKINGGTVFRITTTGVEKVLHRFGSYPEDGVKPVASLIDVKGELYGTTYNGGTANSGTVFKISTGGREKVLHSFAPYTDGLLPAANLVNVNGTLYGTTGYGPGASNAGYGTVFSVSTTGTENVLYNFPYGASGGIPLAGLIDVKGTLYGTTAYGGIDQGGTAFSITTSGSLTSIHSFGRNAGGGLYPYAPLLNVKGTLYGTTSSGVPFQSGKGAIFRMSLTGTTSGTGTAKVLHTFGDGFDGATPLAGLIDVKGTLYGTTSAGGTYGEGTVFALPL